MRKGQKGSFRATEARPSWSSLFPRFGLESNGNPKPIATSDVVSRCFQFRADQPRTKWSLQAPRISSDNVTAGYKQGAMR